MEEIPLDETDYQKIVETMSEGLIVLDSNGVVVYVNNRFCEMLGYSKNEILGRPAAVFLDEENQTILREQLSKSPAWLEVCPSAAIWNMQTKSP